MKETNESVVEQTSIVSYKPLVADVEGLEGLFVPIAIDPDATLSLSMVQGHTLAIKREDGSSISYYANDDFILKCFTGNPVIAMHHAMNEYQALSYARDNPFLSSYVAKVHCFGMLLNGFRKEWPALLLSKPKGSLCLLEDAIDGVLFGFGTLGTFAPSEFAATVANSIVEACQGLRRIGRSHGRISTSSVVLAISQSEDQEKQKSMSIILDNLYECVPCNQDDRDYDAENTLFNLQRLSCSQMFYAAPELVSRFDAKPVSSFSMDVYAIGMVLAEMLVGHQALLDVKNRTKGDDLQTGLNIEDYLPRALTTKDHLTRQLLNVVFSCTNPIPELRPSLPDLGSYLAQIVQL